MRQQSFGFMLDQAMTDAGGNLAIDFVGVPVGMFRFE
jgi:hypothetical protein